MNKHKHKAVQKLLLGLVFIFNGANSQDICEISDLNNHSINQIREYFLSCETNRNITNDLWLSAELQYIKQKTLFFISDEDKKLFLAAVTFCRINNTCNNTLANKSNKKLIKDIKKQIYKKNAIDRIADKMWQGLEYQGNDTKYFLNHWNTFVAKRISDAQTNQSKIQISKYKVANFLLARYPFDASCKLISSNPQNNNPPLIENFVRQVYTLKKCPENNPGNCRYVYDCSSAINQGQTVSNSTYQKLLDEQNNEVTSKRNALINNYTFELTKILSNCQNNTSSAEGCIFSSNDTVQNNNTTNNSNRSLNELVTLAKQLQNNIKSGDSLNYIKIEDYIPSLSCIDGELTTGVESCRK